MAARIEGDGPIAGGYNFSATDASVLTVDAGNAVDGVLTLPFDTDIAGLLLGGTYSRQGPDLQIEDGGQSILVTNYFLQSSSVSITAPGGETVSGRVASVLAGPANPGEYAQAVGGAAATQIGEVVELTGDVTVRRVDGTTETADIGTPIYQDDLIETSDSASVGLEFVDLSTFALGSDARLIIDELVYEPGADSSMNMNLVQGAFSFVSGQIAKSGDDDMVIQTPVATIGIRGTAGTGDQNKVALLEEAGGTTGEITFTTQGGSVVLTQPNQVTGADSPFDAPTAPTIVPLSDIQAEFGAALQNLPVNLPANENIRNTTGDGSDSGDSDDGDSGGEDAESEDEAEAEGEGETDTAEEGEGEGEGDEAEEAADAEGEGESEDAAEGTEVAAADGNEEGEGEGQSESEDGEQANDGDGASDGDGESESESEEQASDGEGESESETEAPQQKVAVAPQKPPPKKPEPATGTKPGSEGAKGNENVGDQINKDIKESIEKATSDSGGQGGDSSDETGGDVVVVDPVPTTVIAEVIDARIKNALVFIDSNSNREHDAGESFAFTDAFGKFSLQTFDADAEIVISGGVDVSTGLPFDGVLVAPGGSKVVTPLTSLMQEIIAADLAENPQGPALTTAQAQTVLLDILGISLPSGINLTTFDPIQAITGINPTTNEPTAAAEAAEIVFAAGLKVTGVLVQVTSAITGLDETLSTQEVASVAIKSLAANLAALSSEDALHGDIDAYLSDSGSIDALFDEIAGRLPLVDNVSPLDSAELAALKSASGALAGLAAESIAVINDAIANGEGNDALKDMIRAQRIVQGDAAREIFEAFQEEGTGAGLTGRLTEFEDRFVGGGQGGGGFADRIADDEAAFPIYLDDDITSGTNNAEAIVGSNGDDLIEGLGGNDIITGLGGRDLLFGDGGSDIIDGGSDADTIFGGNDADDLRGNTGDDILYGDAGNDILSGGDGSDILNGGAGDDVLLGDAGNDVIYGDAGNDILQGGSGTDVLLGGAGDDTLLADGDGDFFAGGTAEFLDVNQDGRPDAGVNQGNFTQVSDSSTNDTVSYAGATTTVTASLTSNTGTVAGGAGVDVYVGIENLTGGDADDLLTGSTGANVLAGGAGNDVLDGVAGADTVLGGDGDDVIVFNQDLVGNGAVIDGGDGTDRFLVAGGSNVDLTSATSATISGVELFDLQDGGDSTVTISAEGILSLGGTIAIGGDSNDLVETVVGEDWVFSKTVVIDNKTFDEFSITTANGVAAVRLERGGPETDSGIGDAPFVNQSFGAALAFDGTDDVVDFGDDPALAPGADSATVDTWFFWGGSGQTSGTIVSRGNATAADEGFRIFIENDALILRVNADPAGGALSQAATHIDMSGKEAGWYNVAMVVDVKDGANNDQISGYLNGSNDGWAAGDTDTVSSNIFSQSGDGIAGTADFLVGAVDTGSGQTGFFNGAVDEVRIWDQAFTRVEIPDLVGGLTSSSQTNLRTWWRFEDLGSSTANEEVDGDLNGSISGATYVTSEAALTHFFGGGLDSESRVPVEITVQSLIEAMGADHEDDTLGIAITDAPVDGFGGDLSPISDAVVWEYAVDGVNFVPLTNVSENSALLLTAPAKLRFTPNNDNVEGDFDLAFHAWDLNDENASGDTGIEVSASLAADGGQSSFSADTQVLRFDVQGPNTIPTVTVTTASVSLDEDTSLAIDGFEVDDVDAAAAPVVVTLSVTNGIIDVDETAFPATAGDFTTTIIGDGTNTVALFGSIADINALIATQDGIVYFPDEDFEGADTFTIDINDLGNTGFGGPLAASDSISITVDPVQDAPRIISANDPEIVATLAEDTAEANNSGVGIAEFISTIAFDPDVGAVGGVAITGLDDSNGAWQFSTDGGDGWTDISAVSEANALVLTDDGQNRIRFLPEPNFFGTPTLTVRAWDQTDGSSNGDFVDITEDEEEEINVSGATTGGGGVPEGAFSDDDIDIAIDVTPVNDAPIVTPFSGDEFQVNTGGTTNVDSQVLALADGRYLVAWSSEVGSGDSDILVRLFAADHQPLGGEVTVNNTASFPDTTPQLAQLANGDVALTWHSVVDGSGNPEIKATVFSVEDDNSIILPASDITVSATPADALEPQIVALSGGGFAVAWEEVILGDPTHSDAVFRILDSSGTLVSPQRTLHAFSDENQGPVALAASDDGGFFAIWTDGNAGTGTTDRVTVQRVAAEGALVLRDGSNPSAPSDDADSFTIGAELDNVKVTDAVALSDGGIAVVWHGETSANNEDFFVQFINADGSLRGSEIQVHDRGGDGSSGFAQLTATDDGGVVVAWLENLAAGDSGTDVLAQRLDSNGASIGDPVLISDDFTGNQDFPDIALLPNGQVVGVFEDAATSGIAARAFSLPQENPVIDANGQILITQFDADEIDSGESVLEATISATNGKILLDTEQFDGTVVSGNGTSTVLIQGTIGQINDLLNTADGVEFVATSLGINASVTVTVDDLGNVGAGGALNDSATITFVPSLTETIHDQSSNTLFGTVSNWSDGLPDGSKSAVFNGAGTLIHNIGTTLVGEFTANTDFTLSGGTLTSVYGGDVISGETFRLQGGELVLRHGSLAVDGTFEFAGGAIGAGDGTLFANGPISFGTVVTLDGQLHLNSAAAINGLIMNGDGSLQFSSAVTIQDTNTFNARVINSNDGSLTVDISSPSILTLNGGITNSGAMTITGDGAAGARIVLGEDSIFTNTGALTIDMANEAEAASISGRINNTGSITLSDTLVVDGELRTESGSIFIAANQELRIANGAALRLGAATQLTGVGSIVFAAGAAAVELESDFVWSSSTLGFDVSQAAVTIDGPGAFIFGTDFALPLGDEVFNAEVIVDAGVVLTLNSPIADAALELNGGLTNDGTLVLSGENLSLNTGGETIVNNGTLVVDLTAATDIATITGNLTNESQMSIEDNLTVIGTFQNNGTLDIAEGVTLIVDGGQLVNDGTIIGQGQIEFLNGGQLVNSGIIDAGGSDTVATLDIAGGAVIFEAGSTLQVDVTSEGVDRVSLSSIDLTTTTDTLFLNFASDIDIGSLGKLKIVDIENYVFGDGQFDIKDSNRPDVTFRLFHEEDGIFFEVDEFNQPAVFQSVMGDSYVIDNLDALQAQANSHDVIAAPVSVDQIDNFTIEAKVKWDGTDSDSNQVVWGNGDTPNDGYALELIEDGGTGYTFGVRIGGGSLLDSGVSVVADQVAHVAVVREDGAWKLVIDGTEHDLASTEDPLTPTVSFHLGRNTGAIGPGGQNGFFGEIDDVRLFDIARDTTSIVADADRLLTGLEDSLIAYYQGGLVDQTGNGNDFVSNNNVTLDGALNAPYTSLNFAEDVGGQAITGLSVADPEETTDPITVTLSTDQGILTLSETVSGGITSVDVTGNGTGSITVTATIAAINATLEAADGLTFTPPVNFEGDGTFTLTTDDGISAGETTLPFTVFEPNIAPDISGARAFDGSLQFDGVDASVDLGTGASLRTGTGAFTWEAWVNIAELPGSGDFMRILRIGDTNPEKAALTINDSGQAVLALSGATNAVSADSVTTGEWVHIAAVHEGGAPGLTQMFINGQPSGAAVSQNININGGIATIGSDQELAGDAVALKGEVAEVRIWSEARTDADIAGNFDSKLETPQSIANLEGYWQFDDVGPDGVSPDLTGNGNDARVGQGIPADPFGRVLSLDGSDDHIEFGAAGDLATGTGDFTWEAWIRPDNTGIRQTILSLGDGTNNAGGLFRVEADGTLDFSYPEASGVTGATVLTDGQFHHVAVVHSGGSLQLFVDGVAEGAPVSAPADLQAGDTFIGESLFGGDVFQGEIADVRVWDIARSETELADNKDDRLNGDENGLLAYWKLDEGDGSTIEDSAIGGAGHQGDVFDGGSIHADAPWVNESPLVLGPNAVGRSIAFDGVDDRLIAGRGPDDVLAITGDVTLEAWVRPNSVEGTQTIINFAGEGGQESDNVLYQLELRAGGLVRTFHEAGTGFFVNDFDAGITANAWHHIAAVKDDNEQTWTVYVNGEQVGEPVSYSASGSATGGELSELIIGQRSDGIGSFDGLISDVRVWDIDRSAEQIASNYQDFINESDIHLVANWQMNEVTGGDLPTVVDNTDNAIHAVPTGDTELGAEFQVNTTTADAQTIASVAALADGGYVVVWDSLGQDGDADGVFGQRYDANDNPVGAEFQINTIGAGDQGFSTVVGLADGGFVAAWRSVSSPSGDVDVFARVFDADGEPLAAEFQMNTTLTGDQDSVKIEALAGGDFIAVWESAGQDGSDNAVILQRFDAFGTAVGAEILVNTETTGAQGLPDVTALTDGGFVVTWESIGQDGEDGGIFFQRFDDTGAATGTETAVNTTTLRSQDEPTVVGLANGGFAVLWDSQVDASFDENIIARIFDADGQPVTGEFQVNVTTANDQRLVEAVALPDGGFIAAWESDGQDGDGLGLFAQRFSSTGGAVGGEFRINLQNSGDQEEISLTVLANGDVVAAYQSFGHDGDDLGIFARRIGFDGPDLVTTSPASFTDTIEVQEDGSVTVQVLVQDANGDDLTASIPADGEPANGTAVFDLETGFLTYIPDPDFSGTDTITIEVSDGETTSSKTFTINVIGDNDAPVIGQTELAAALGAIVSTFDDDADGWTVINDSPGVEFVAEGGNPDGHIQASDLGTGGIYSFAAPAKFLGDKSAFSGGTFKFDTRTDSVSPVPNSALILQGAALTLVAITPSPGAAFETVSVSLDTATDWRVGSGSGAVATQAQIDAVLSDLTAIHVPGEYGGDLDTGSLDNVQMTPPFVEGQNIVLTLTADDADGDELTFTIDTLPNDGRLFQTADGVTPGAEITAGGTVVSNADGKVIFVSDALVSDASISFDFTATDPDNLSDTGTLTFDVVNVSDPISPGGAIQFDGVNDRLVVSGSADVSFGSTEDFSLEAWIYSTSDGSSRVILDNRDGTTGGYALMLDVDNNLEFRMIGTNPAPSVSILSDTAVAVNEWTHVAVTADRDGNATLYINGVEVGSETIAGDNGTNISGDLFIGHDSENIASAENPFEGMIDEVRIWGDVRTASEISQNAGQQVATDEADLNAYYRFDDQATVDIEIIDLTGNGNGAFLGGIDGFGDLEPAFINHLGKAIAPAAGGENSVADDPHFQPESGSLSVSSWFFYDGETVLSDQYLINKGNQTETDEGYSILLRDDNKLVVRASTDAGTTAGAAAQTFDLAGLSTGWHQVTMVIDQDGSAGEVRGYLDGFRDGWADDASLGGTFAPGSISESSRFVVGRNGITAGEEFDSLIADVRVFKAALTDLEVDFYQLQALAGDEPNLVGYWTFAGLSESGTFTDLSGNGHDLDIPGGVFNLVDVLAPITGDEVQVKENTTISGIMSGGEAQDGTVFSISQGLASGTVTIDSDTGEWFVTADPNATGSETFQVQVTAGGTTSFQDIRVIYEDLTFDPTVSGAALQFEGSNTTGAAIASAIQGIPTTNQQITYELWLNPAVVNTPNTPVSYAVPSTDNELTLSFVNGNLEVGVGGILHVSSVPIFENEWQHVAVSYDSVTETVNVYKNGVLGDSFEMTGAGAIEADGTLVLGQDQDSVGGGFAASDAYSGQLDEFRFWNTLRTAEEIADNYNGQVAPDDIDLIAYYRADGSDGTTLVDLTGTNTAALTDVDVLTHLGRAVRFDGNEGNIVIADDGAYSSQTFTIEAWFKSDAGSPGVAQRIVSKAHGASSNTWTLSVADGLITAAGQINGVPVTLTGTSGGDVRDGLWHHAAYSFDGTTLRLYLDGEEVDSVVPGSSVLDIDGNPVMIGDYDNTDTFQQNFQGEISDVRIWDVERSATEIDSDKDNRLNGDEAGLVGYWPLDGESDGDGSVAVDFSANGNDGFLQNGAEFVRSAPEVFGTDVSTLEGVTVSGHFDTVEALGEQTFSITGGASDGNGVTSLVIAGEGTAYVSESSGAWWFAILTPASPAYRRLNLPSSGRSGASTMRRLRSTSSKSLMPVTTRSFRAALCRWRATTRRTSCRQQAQPTGLAPATR
ncbi:MAG: LamG-like jellyroll fold domain-containing protein [Alphaproteobacteria bacterium]